MNTQNEKNHKEQDDFLVKVVVYIVIHCRVHMKFQLN